MMCRYDLDLFPLTQETLRKLLHYDPETGHFTWIMRTANRNQPGDRAGAQKNSGYRFICFQYKRLKEHRLAFLYMTGEWPEKLVDHVNGDKADNRWANIRLATPQQNACNKRVKPGRSTKGISWIERDQRWLAQIVHQKKSHFLGHFVDKEKAQAAYNEAALRLHGEFARIA